MKNNNRGKDNTLVPLFSTSVTCGYPSETDDDHVDMPIDFNELILPHRSSTYCLRASGDSLKDAGILDGDIIVVDKSLEPINNNLVVAMVDGGFTAKRLRIETKNGVKRIWLHPENEDYNDIEITETMEFSLFGVISGVVRTLR